jgi:multicomponent Na+:H+ antiporter subunit B
MSLIVKNITRLTIGILFLFGIYIVLHGHLTPGGGFAGGVILALVYILYVLAFGKPESEAKADEKKASVVESSGAMMFLAVALLGLAGGWFFLNLLPKGEPGNILSAGFIPISNLAIMLKVGGGLFAVFLVLVALRLSVNKEDPLDELEVKEE